MKNLYLTLLSCFIAVLSMAQTPGFSYQAVILNPEVQSLPGNDVEQGLLSESDISIRFTIENELGTEYQETHTTKTDAYGMVNLIVGQGMATIGSFIDIAWVGAEKYLKVEIDFTASGANYENLDRQALTYLPQPVSNETMVIIDQINADVSSNNDAIKNEVSRATAAEGVNALDIDTNATDIATNTSGIATNTTAIAALTCGLSIGDLAEGGIIFYLDPSGCHGLVAKDSDEPSGFGLSEFSTTNFLTYARASGIYGGAQNTKKIIHFAGLNASTSPAASVCDDLIWNGYSDWYLPSKDELDMMFVNLHLNGLGNLFGVKYQSSTETDDNLLNLLGFDKAASIYIQWFNSPFVHNGMIIIGSKTDSRNTVRAIRAF